MAPKFSDDRISGFLDGNLSAEESAELRREVSRDPELKILVEELRQARSEVQALPRMRLGDDFTARVMAAVGQATMEPAATPASATPRPAVSAKSAARNSWAAFALGALAASMVGIGAFQFLRTGDGPVAVRPIEPLIGDGEVPSPAKVIADDQGGNQRVEPIPAQGTLTLAELQEALQKSAVRSGETFVARVSVKTEFLKTGGIDQALLTQGVVVTPVLGRDAVLNSVATIWKDLTKEEQAGTIASLSPIREVFYLEATPQAVESSLAAIGTREEIQVASDLNRTSGPATELLAGVMLPRRTPGEAVGESANTPAPSGILAPGAAVRVGRKQLMRTLGQEEAPGQGTSAAGTSEVLLVLRVK